MGVGIYSAIALFLGILFDFLVGDPQGWYHPVMAVGWLVKKTEQALRGIFPHTPKGERLAGGVLAAVVAGCSVLVPGAFLFACYRVHPVAGILLETLMCGSLLAAKSLKMESMRVAKSLEEGGLDAGREAVSMIVGRDTKGLSEAGVIKAAVETVAENTSDGVVAPMFYMALFGGVGGFFYKSVNTMDSMVGYKNEAYQYFGTAAAKLDDILNFIPARVSAVAMALSCPLCGMDMRGAFRIFLRDRYCHASPNSAQTEAVMAGALKVQLAGDAWYFGKKHKKPTIGDDIRPVELEDIRRSNRLMYAAAILCAALFLGIKAAVLFYVLKGGA